MLTEQYKEYLDNQELQEFAALVKKGKKAARKAKNVLTNKKGQVARKIADGEELTRRQEQHHLQRVATSLIDRKHHGKLFGNEYHPSIRQAAKHLNKGNVSKAREVISKGIGIPYKNTTSAHTNRASYHATHVQTRQDRLKQLGSRALATGTAKRSSISA